MLLRVLNSDAAIEMNTRIIRVGVQLERILTASGESNERLTEIED